MQKAAVIVALNKLDEKVKKLFPKDIQIKIFGLCVDIEDKSSFCKVQSDSGKYDSQMIKYYKSILDDIIINDNDVINPRCFKIDNEKLINKVF